MNCERTGSKCLTAAAASTLDTEPLAFDDDTLVAGRDGRGVAFTHADQGAPAAWSESPVQATAPPAMPRWKRAMDVALASTAVVVLSPLLVGVALLIKLVSRGPICFRQQRAGYRGESFTIWKFRTMHVTTNSQRHRQYVAELLRCDGKLQKINDRTDLILFGRWMRVTGIDELPQLFNVLRGEMSLIGPRPDVIPYEDYAPWQKRRFDVLPGITGLWQVSGKNSTTFEEMMLLDIEYIRRRSLWLDLQILFMTPPAILAQALRSS